jgi:hypothetical protein
MAIELLTGEVGVETQMIQGQGETAPTDSLVKVTDDLFYFGGCVEVVVAHDHFVIETVA